MTLLRILFVFCVLLSYVECWGDACVSSSHVKDLDWRISQCTTNGWLMGYSKTYGMMPSNANASFDPHIQISYNFCWGLLGCSRHNTITLRPGECRYMPGSINVIAERKIIGISGSRVCSDSNPDSCPQQIDAICAYYAVAPDCSGARTLLKCLPIPLTPGPGNVCDAAALPPMPRLGYVSRAEGNNYFTNKVNLIMGGSGTKGCVGFGGSAYYVPMTDGCSGSDVMAVVDPQTLHETVELGYDVNAGDEYRVAKTVKYNGVNNRIDFVVRRHEICATTDVGFVGCIYRAPMQPPKIELHNSDPSSGKFRIVAQEDPTYHVDAPKVSGADAYLQKTTKSVNFYGHSLSVFQASPGSDGYIDQHVICYNGSMASTAEGCNVNGVKDVTAKECTSAKVIVKTGSACPAGNVGEKVVQARECVPDRVYVDMTKNCAIEGIKAYIDDSSGSEMCIRGWQPQHSMFFADIGSGFEKFQSTDEMMFELDKDLLPGKQYVSGNGMSMFDVPQGNLDTMRPDHGKFFKMLYNGDFRVYAIEQKTYSSPIVHTTTFNSQGRPLNLGMLLADKTIHTRQPSPKQLGLCIPYP